MAIRKKGSRPIDVDGVSYRWRIRRKATYDQWAFDYGTLTVSVELADKPGTVLIAFTNHPHPDCYTTATPHPITPKHVADCVRQALSEGWQPTAKGPQFILRFSSMDGPPVIAPAS